MPIDYRLVQAKLNPNKAREKALIDLLTHWENVKNPASPEGDNYTQKDVIIMALEEWSQTVPDYPPSGEYMFTLLKRLESTIVKAIRDSHKSLLETLATLDLSAYVDTNTGRTMHDEIGGLLVDDKTLENLTSEPIIEYEDDNEDEPGDW